MCESERVRERNMGLLHPAAQTLSTRARARVSHSPIARLISDVNETENDQQQNKKEIHKFIFPP